MKTKLDWSSLGQFFSTVLSLFTVIRNTFEGMRVGMPIVPWLLNGEGKMALTACLTELGLRYRAAMQVEAVTSHSLRVYLDAPITLPFPSMTIESGCGEGTIDLVWCNGQLYVDGRQVVLKKTEDFADPNRNISGQNLLERLKETDSLHPNIIDALLKHPQMIPDQWFGFGHMSICFAAVVFRSPPYNNPGMAHFFGVETHMSPSQLFLRSLSISGGQIGFRSARNIQARVEWMDGTFAPSALFAVLE